MVPQTTDDQFLDELLVTAGFDPKEDDLEILKQDLLPVLEEKIILKLYEALPTQEDRERFDTIMTTDEEIASEGLHDFFVEKIPNFDDFMADVYLEFQEEYLSAMNEE